MVNMITVGIIRNGANYLSHHLRKNDYRAEGEKAVLGEWIGEGATALGLSGEVTDEPEDVMIAELIREAALEGVHDELPHSIAVIVEEMEERPQAEDDPRKPLLIIRAQLYVERDSQKGIIIGHGGERLKAVGAEARAGIERLLGRKVYLDLHVKIAKEWQRDPKQLGRMGF